VFLLVVRTCCLYASCVSIVELTQAAFPSTLTAAHAAQHDDFNGWLSLFFAFRKYINVLLQVYEEADVNVERFLEHVRKWEEQEAAKAAKNKKQGGKQQAGTTQGDASKAVDAQAKT
jgi:hypothetical protein